MATSTRTTSSDSIPHAGLADNEYPIPPTPMSGRINPFATPPLSSGAPTRRSSIGSRPSSNSLASGLDSKPGEWFRSRRVRMRGKDNRREVRQSWQESWVPWLLPMFGMLLGLGISGFLVWNGVERNSYTYTLVLDEDFSAGFLDPKIWTFEQEVGGFGNGEFEQTTDSPENVFIQDGMLHIQPTLQDAALINNNATINLNTLGVCSSDQWYNCITTTNTTNGTIVQPARSGRLNTKLGASITYGRVEVTAKIPQGDWLWPAIWMLPVDEAYGGWPLSGEIDIMESRGNNHTYWPGGNNLVSSTLHYGTDPGDDAYLTANNRLAALHTEYGNDFHVYGLEWTPHHIFTYVDSRLLQVMYIDIDQSFWSRGGFPAASPNGTLLTNPWMSSPNPSAPFDKAFYLILNVAVGGTNGWFIDMPEKPWSNASPFAKHEFWGAREQWGPTWEGRSAMVVKRVQMWQQGP